MWVEREDAIYIGAFLGSCFLVGCGLLTNPAEGFMARYRRELAAQKTAADSVALSEDYLRHRVDSFPTLPHDSLQAMKDVVNGIWQRENEGASEATTIAVDSLGKAEFIGGEAALQAYLKANLRYPVSAVEKRIEGTVALALIINPDSTVAGVRLLSVGANAVIAGEANRLALSMQKKWQPAMVNKKAVRSTATVRVVFELPK